MELHLFQKNGIKWTRIKVGNKEIKHIPPQILKRLGEPVRKSSRYIYFEVEGDLLNKK